MPADVPPPPPPAHLAQADKPMVLPVPAFGHRLNPTARTLRFIVPVTDGTNYLGDVELAVAPDDALSVVAPRLVQMLEPILKKDVFQALRTRIGSSAEVSLRTHCIA